MGQKKSKKTFHTLSFILYISAIVLLISLFYFISASFASPQKLSPEIELGRKIFAQIRPHVTFTRNPMIKQSVEKLGKRILNDLSHHQYEFRFFPIISSDVNAFALPNGYIFITNRLIQSCDSEDELAFVLCHETAHVLRGHFMNFLAQKKKMDLTTLALMVLGAVVARDSDLQGGIPAISMGINQNLTLSYSREQEYEADTYGFRYLSHSDFNVNDASKFMDKLRLLSQITISVPVYLSTHPMPMDRLINIKRLEKTYPSKNPQPCLSNMSRLKLWCRLETELSDRLLDEFNPLYLSNPNDIDMIYALALINEKLGSSEKAEKYYQMGVSHAPKDRDLLRDYGIFLYRREQVKDAESRLKLCVEQNPEDPVAYHYLGRIKMDGGSPDEAIQSFLKSKEIAPELPDNYHFLGILYSQKGDEEESHKNFEHYFTMIGNLEAAELHSKKRKNSEGVMGKNRSSSK